MVGPVRLNSNTKAAAHGWDVCGVRLKGFGIWCAAIESAILVLELILMPLVLGRVSITL